MTKFDNIHYRGKESEKVQSFAASRKYVCVISPREPGKSTEWICRCYDKFRKYNLITIVIRRRPVDITEAYISTLQDTLNEFVDPGIEFECKGNLKQGIVDIYINDKMFLRVQALSIPVARAKSLGVPGRIYRIIFDEFIVCKGKLKEKYLDNEWFRFQEAIDKVYSRYCRDRHRHKKMLKCEFYGNPYSVLNPVFANFKGLNFNEIKPGAFLTGNNWVIDCLLISDELKEEILKSNPDYAEMDEYAMYAFNGEAIEDKRFILTPQQPKGYKLRWLFKAENTIIGIFYNTKPVSVDDSWFWVKTMNEYKGKSKPVMCFDFDEMLANSILIDKDIKDKVKILKKAIANQKVSFADLKSGYLVEEIYQAI